MVTGNLEHPGIPVVYERGLTEEGAPFYVMTRIRGRTLSEEIAAAETDEARLTLISVVISVAQTLGYAHDRGVVHRDIKPDNIIVGDYGEVAVIDWGIAKVRGIQHDDAALSAALDEVRSGDLTQMGQVLGTPSHMAPEQARGDIDGVDGRTDVFALGSLLYHILAGRPPYKEDSALKTILKAHEAEFDDLRTLAPTTDPALLAIVERAMSRDKKLRYEGAGEMAGALEAWLASAATRDEGSAFTRWFASGLSALMLVFVLGSLVLVLSNTPLLRIGLLALGVLVLGIFGCALNLVEWRTRGRHHLSSLCLALAAISFLIGMANAIFGELRVQEVLASSAMKSDPVRAAQLREFGAITVLSSMPIVLVMTAVQVTVWALVSRAVARMRA